MLHLLDSFIYVVLSLGLAGLFVLAFLDSTILFYMPFALDTILILLISHHKEWCPFYVAIALAGSLAGATLTYWMVRKMSEEVLEKHVPRQKFNRIKKKMTEKGFW